MSIDKRLKVKIFKLEAERSGNPRKEFSVKTVVVGYRCMEDHCAADNFQTIPIDRTGEVIIRKCNSPSCNVYYAIRFPKGFKERINRLMQTEAEVYKHEL